MKCFVYLIRCRSFYKIGIASNVHKRFLNLQSSNPLPMETMISFEYESREKALEVETCLHRMFQNVWVRNEWYKLSSEQIQTLKNYCQDTDGLLLDYREALQRDILESNERYKNYERELRARPRRER